MGPHRPGQQTDDGEKPAPVEADRALLRVGLASAGLCRKGHGSFFGFEVPAVGPGRTAHRIGLKPRLRPLVLDPRSREVGADGGELLGSHRRSGQGEGDQSRNERTHGGLIGSDLQEDGGAPVLMAKLLTVSLWRFAVRWSPGGEL